MVKLHEGDSVRFVKGDAVKFLRGANVVNAGDIGTVIELVESWYRIRVNGLIRCIGFELGDQILELVEPENPLPLHLRHASGAPGQLGSDDGER